MPAVIPVYTAVRIIPRETDYLNRKAGTQGEIFFDREANSLRVYDGANRGGVEIARSDLANIDDSVFAAKATAAGVGGGGSDSSASIEISDTAPSTPESGTIWFNTSNARLYVYVYDGNTAQWVQPASPYTQINALTDLGITDGSNGQVLTTDGSGNFSFEDAASGGVDLTAFSVGADASASGDGGIAYDNSTGVFTYTPPDLSGYLTSLDSGDITTALGYTPYNGATNPNGYITSYSETDTLNSVTGRGATTTNSISAGDITSSGTVSATDINSSGDVTVGGNIITTGSGTPELSSDNEILLTATTRVTISATPIKLASLTTTERNGLTPQNGDIIYNSTDNKFQGYENGSWVNLI